MNAAKLLAFLAGVLIVTSCGTRYITVPVYRDRTEVKVERDSVHTIDTVRIQERGDTVRLSEIRYKTHYITRVDTVVRVDTVEVPREIIVPRPETERNLLGGLWSIIVTAVITAAVMIIIQALRK